MCGTPREHGKGSSIPGHSRLAHQGGAQGYREALEEVPAIRDDCGGEGNQSGCMDTPYTLIGIKRKGALPRFPTWPGENFR